GPIPDDGRPATASCARPTKISTRGAASGGETLCTMRPYSSDSANGSWTLLTTSTACCSPGRPSAYRTAAITSASCSTVVGVPSVAFHQNSVPGTNAPAASTSAATHTSGRGVAHARTGPGPPPTNGSSGAADAASAIGSAISRTRYVGPGKPNHPSASPARV